MLAYIFTRYPSINSPEFTIRRFDVLGRGLAAITIYTKTDQRRIENC
jgi:hypothetical protein